MARATTPDRFWAAKQLAVAARGGPSSDGWAAKRVVNLHRLLKKAMKDDALLFKEAWHKLDAFAHLLGSIGDEAGSLYVQSLARLLENKCGWGPSHGPTGAGAEGRVHRRKKS